MNLKYNEEHKKYLTDNIKGRSLNEISNMFNEHFDLSIKQSSIISLIYRLGLHNERDAKFNKGYEPTQFKKGHVPFNKGKKKFWKGGEETQFKKGNKAYNWVPIGTERINKDGYIEIKVQDGKLQKNWRGKHIVIWEAANGPLPKGSAIIFGDGNNRNFDINNLILVSRKQLLILNRHKLIQNNADLTRTGVIIANLYSKISDRKASQ